MRARKRVTQKEKVWDPPGNGWQVYYGQIKRGPGKPKKWERRSLFKVVGEKLPFKALGTVKKHLGKQNVGREGIYMAHDSMGCVRYIGRGDIFTRLMQHHRKHKEELCYFSFFIVAAKKHEREIETILIRAAGPQLFFNERKKRDDIEPGDVRDYEMRTHFYERQYQRGAKNGTRHARNGSAVSRRPSRSRSHLT